MQQKSNKRMKRLNCFLFSLIIICVIGCGPQKQESSSDTIKEHSQINKSCQLQNTFFGLTFGKQYSESEIRNAIKNITYGKTICSVSKANNYLWYNFSASDDVVNNVKTLSDLNNLFVFSFGGYYWLGVNIIADISNTFYQIEFFSGDLEDDHNTKYTRVLNSLKKKYGEPSKMTSKKLIWEDGKIQIQLAVEDDVSESGYTGNMFRLIYCDYNASAKVDAKNSSEL